MLHTLRSSETPFLINPLLTPFLPEVSPLAAEDDPCVKAEWRGGETGLHIAEGQRWLVTEPEGLDRVVAHLRDACQRASLTGDPALSAQIVHVQTQISLGLKYRELGYRPGLCVPWGITSEYRPSCKVHAARLRRSETEPYLLLADHALCKAFMKSPADFRDAPIDCGYCLRMMRQHPEGYPLAAPQKAAS